MNKRQFQSVLLHSVFLFALASTIADAFVTVTVRYYDPAAFSMEMNREVYHYLLEGQLPWVFLFSHLIVLSCYVISHVMLSRRKGVAGLDVFILFTAFLLFYYGFAHINGAFSWLVPFWR